MININLKRCIIITDDDDDDNDDNDINDITCFFVVFFFKFLR